MHTYIHFTTKYALCHYSLQLLHCNYHTGDGGENVFVDGFHVADQLKQKDLDAFEFLAKTKIPSFYYVSHSLIVIFSSDNNL